MRLPLTTSASTLLLAVLLAARAALAADLTVYLPSTPNPFGLPPATHATLAALGRPRASAPVTSVNTFVFRGVPAGSYLLDVHCTTDAFVPLRVDIAEDGAVEAWETFRGNDWDNKGERLVVRDGSAGRGFEVRAVGHKNYFMDRPTCECSPSPHIRERERNMQLCQVVDEHANATPVSVLTILKNPMILLGIASMGLVFGMPKLLESSTSQLPNPEPVPVSHD